MENAQIADVFDEIAGLVELIEGDQFRIRPHRNATRTIRSLPWHLEEMRSKVPQGLTRIMGVPQIGPRKAMQLSKDLGVTSLEELREACEAGRVRVLAGTGAETEANILERIELLERTAGRVSVAAAHEPADLELMRWGADVARRGWLGRGDVIDARTERQLRRDLERR